ncbi:MAG TPA: ChbG/HpnK family deacetylase [Methylovirgula sp.]
MTLFSLCADDFGLSEGVSRGILSVHAAERLTAISVMTTRPAWRNAARDLAASAPTTDLGLHLNLTLAAPLTAMPKLAPTGTLPTLADLLALARSGRLEEDDIGREIAEEIVAQLYAFGVAFGRFPDFIDGHHHVHVLPGIRKALFGVLQKKGLRGQLWLRDPGDHPWRILRRQIGIKKALEASQLARHFVEEAHTYGFAVNEGFSGYSAGIEGRDYADDFESYLIAPGPAHLIMCHPGHVDDDLVQLDSRTKSREAELAFLLSPRFDEMLDQHGAALGRLTGQARA